MKTILLLGAGFTRNWGGWLGSEAFEYLIGCPEILLASDLRDLLWKHQFSGFEYALAEIQAAYAKAPDAQKDRLQAMQGAIRRMFADMNDGLREQTLELGGQSSSPRGMADFLSRFDAIFSLNQDLFLEQSYLGEVPKQAWPAKWAGSELPGMARVRQSGDAQEGWAIDLWSPIEGHDVQPTTGLQPYFKLHGSSNWITRDGQQLLIMGGDKTHEIRLHPILHNYARIFKDYLVGSDVRLMVVGYSFRDSHINDVIKMAVQGKRLRMFIIDPQGSEIAYSLNPTTAHNRIYIKGELEEAFEAAVVGASRRTLRETFGRDRIEQQKILRFFE